MIADYRDIVGSPPRSEEELHREVGDPEQVVRLLVQPPKAYYAWLAVFAALAACLLAAALAPLPASPFYMLLKWYEWGGSYHLAAGPCNPFSRRHAPFTRVKFTVVKNIVDTRSLRAADAGRARLCLVGGVAPLRRSGAAFNPMDGGRILHR